MEYMENQMDDKITGANLHQEESNSFKLISMTDFVLYKKASHTQIMKYAQFLKQALSLGKFVPCDEEGNVLEEPKGWSWFSIDPCRCEKCAKKYNIHELDNYKKAKERVLFEGFYYQSNFSEKQNKLYEYVRNKNPHVFSFEQIKNNTVESLLTGYKKEFLITLTQTAIKQIGL